LNKIFNSEHWSASIKFSGARLKSSGVKTSPIILSIYTVDAILDKIFNSEHWSAAIKCSVARLKSSGDKTSPINFSVYRVNQK
jgi:hypothetical protein